MAVEDVLGELNRRHGTSFELIGRYAAGEGEEGTYRLEDPQGHRYVLEWNEDPVTVESFTRAEATTATLRSTGYPAPAYHLVGTGRSGAYVVREELPGQPIGQITGEWTDGLLRLLELQADRAVVPTERWPQPVVLPVLYGGPGFCLIEPMIGWSQDTADLLDVLQELAAVGLELKPPTRDIVHLDLNTTNVLVAEGRISGVVDWRATCTGDRAFDLATLLFYGYEDPRARDALWRHALEISNRETMGVYLAHIMHRQTEWSIRHHDGATVRRYLSVSSALVEELLAG